MAKTHSNGVSVATGFKNSNPAPIDDRDVVDSFSDLLDENSISTSSLYKWIEVKTNDDGKKYKWNGEDRTVASNWQTAGTPEPTSDGNWVRKKLGNAYSWVLETVTTPFSGNYNDLSNKPDLSIYAVQPGVEIVSASRELTDADYNKTLIIDSPGVELTIPEVGTYTALDLLLNWEVNIRTLNVEGTDIIAGSNYVIAYYGRSLGPNQSCNLMKYSGGYIKTP